MLDSRHWQILAVVVFLFYKVNLNWADRENNKDHGAKSSKTSEAYVRGARGWTVFLKHIYYMYWVDVVGGRRRPRAFVIFCRFQVGWGVSR